MGFALRGKRTFASMLTAEEDCCYGVLEVCTKK
jgi:hypothetical protein